MPSFLFLLAILVFAVATPVLASDGVLEINQACAVQAGCFDGDPAGFPVLITSPGSYVLTSNLSVADADSNGITIQADNVAINLNGFEIAGPVTCTGTGSDLSCTPGTGSGIAASLTEPTTQSEVRHGTIRGFGADGMLLGNESMAEGLTAMGNGGDGLRSLFGGTVKGCKAVNNGGNGLNVAVSTLTECTSSGNRGSGFLVAGGSAIGNTSRGNGEDGFRSFANGTILRDNWASSNDGFGIQCHTANPSGWDACVITGNIIRFNDMGGIAGTNAFLVQENTIRGNGGNGVAGIDAVVVRNNIIYENEGNGVLLSKAAIVDGNAVSGNSANGISVNSSSSVLNNTLRENTGFGLFFLGSQSSYRDNTISINVGGTIGFGPGNIAVDTGGNLCNGSLTCP